MSYGVAMSPGDSIKKAAVYDKRERIRKFMLENPIEYGDPNAYAKEYINILRYFSGTFMKQIFVMHVAMIRDLPFSYFFEICKGIKEINEESENAAETKIFLLKLLFAETNRTFFIKLTKEMREALLTLISDKKSDLIFYLLYMLGDNVRQYVFASLSMKRDPNEKSKHPLEDDMSGLLIPNNPRAGFAFPKIANNGAGPVIKKNGVLKKDKWKYFMDRYGDKVNVWTELMWDDEYHRGDNFNKLIYLFSIWELCKLKIKRVNSFILIIFKHSDIKALFQHKFGFFFCSDTYKKFLTLEHIGSSLETLVSEAQCKHDPLALAVGGNRFFDSDKYNPFKKKVKVVLPPADQGAH